MRADSRPNTPSGTPRGVAAPSGYEGQSLCPSCRIVSHGYTFVYPNMPHCPPFEVRHRPTKGSRLGDCQERPHTLKRNVDRRQEAESLKRQGLRKKAAKLFKTTEWTLYAAAYQKLRPGDLSNGYTYGKAALRPPSINTLELQNQTPTGLAFSGSILYCLIARATSFAVIFPSFASAAIAACAM